MDQDHKTIVVERPTGPRITAEGPRSIGQLVSTRAKSASRSVVAVAVTAAATGIAVLTRHKFASAVGASVVMATVSHLFVSVMLMGIIGGGGAVSGSSYTGPGDLVSGATAFYSCGQAYNAAYANGTNPLCDINAVTGGAAVCTLRVLTNGSVDLAASYCAGTTPAAACAAATGGSCIVSKVYDQTGNGNHQLQAVAAIMPALVFSALGGLPCLTNNVAALQSMITSATFTLNQPWTYTFIAERTGSTAAIDRLFAFNANNSYRFAATAATVGPFNGTSLNNATATESAFHALIANNSTGGGSGTSISFVDGNTVSGSSGSNNVSALPLAFMANQVGTENLIGSVCEAGLWPSTEFSGGQLTSLNSNMHSRWGF